MFKILREIGGHTGVQWIRKGDKTGKGAQVKFGSILYVTVRNTHFISKET